MLLGLSMSRKCGGQCQVMAVECWDEISFLRLKSFQGQIYKMLYLLDILVTSVLFVLHRKCLFKEEVILLVMLNYLSQTWTLPCPERLVHFSAKYKLLVPTAFWLIWQIICRNESVFKVIKSGSFTVNIPKDLY